MHKLFIVGLVVLIAVGCGTGRKLQDSGAPTEVTGVWKRNCSPSSGSYAKGAVDIGNSVLEIEGTKYQDSNCSQPLQTSRMGGTYVLGTNRAKTIDLSVSYIDVTLHTQLDVDFYNALKICESTNWKVDVAMDCKSEAKALYQIYEIDGNTLYLGKNTSGLNGSTPEKRPTEIDKEQAFTK